MKTELINIRKAAEALLKEYQEYGKTLSVFNPFSRISFEEKQPLFEEKCRALLNAYADLNETEYSAEELQEYEQLHDLLIDLKKEIF